MLKRVFGILIFVAVILIVVMAIRENRRKATPTVSTRPEVESYSVPIGADSVAGMGGETVDSLRRDTLQMPETEDLIIQMMGIDTIRGR